MTIGQAAELYAIHPSTVANWIRAGLSVSREGRTGMFDLAVLLPWVRARDRRDLDEAKAASSPDVAKAAKVAAEARLREMDVEEREGGLLKALDVKDRWVQIVVSIREAVMAVAGVAVQAGLVAAEREDELETELRDALVLATRLKAEKEDE